MKIFTLNKASLACKASVLLSLSSAPVIATPFSLSVALGQANTDLAQNHSDIISVDDTSASWAIEFGYQFDWASLQVGYLDLGKANVKLEAESYTPAEYHQSVAMVAPVLVEGVTIGGEKTLWSESNWFINAQLGTIIWQNVIVSESVDGERYRTQDRATDGYLGAKAGYKFNENWSFGAQYRAYILTDYIHEFSGKLSYHF